MPRVHYRQAGSTWLSEAMKGEERLTRDLPQQGDRASPREPQQRWRQSRPRTALCAPFSYIVFSFSEKVFSLRVALVINL